MFGQQIILPDVRVLVQLIEDGRCVFLHVVHHVLKDRWHSCGSQVIGARYLVRRVVQLMCAKDRNEQCIVDLSDIRPSVSVTS